MRGVRDGGPSLQVFLCLVVGVLLLVIRLVWHARTLHYMYTVSDCLAYSVSLCNDTEWQQLTNVTSHTTIDICACHSSGQSVKSRPMQARTAGHNSANASLHQLLSVLANHRVNVNSSLHSTAKMLTPRYVDSKHQQSLFHRSSISTFHVFSYLATWLV